MVLPYCLDAELLRKIKRELFLRIGRPRKKKRAGDQRKQFLETVDHRAALFIEPV
jgi:hypothetical protein